MILNTEFCTLLEYAICRALKELHAKETNGFWCDGVLLPEGEYHYSQKSVNDNKYATLKAFVGKDGQAPYELKLMFGNRALSRYVGDLSLDDCIPSRASKEWFEIDVENKRLVVQLD